MPEYLVIAGPNGAGKSTLSKTLSRPNALIFDPDKEKRQIERNYPDISEEAVEEELTRVYRNFEIRAIGGQHNLTVESNLRTEFVAERADLIKKNGYRTSMIFIALPNLEDSMHRVSLRVKQNGHFVDAESIAYNFRLSLENLSKVARHFDQLMVLDSRIDLNKILIPSALAIYKEGILFYQEPNPEKWSRPILKELKNVFDSDGPVNKRIPGPKR